MTTIGPPPPPPPPGRRDDVPLPPTGVPGPDATKRLQEIARLLGPGSASGPGTLEGASAPSIDAPLLECAPEDMIAFIGAIMAKTQEGQLRTAREGIDVSSRKMEERHTAAMARIKDWIQKTKDADSNSGPGGIFGWMKRIGGPTAAIIGLVVAAAITIATLGTGAPVLVMAFLALGIVSSAMALANHIAQEAGFDQPLDLSYWLAKGFSTMLTDEFGVEGEDAVNGGKMLSGAVPILSLLDPKILGNLAGGTAGFAGADESEIAIVEVAFAVAATVAIMVGGAAASARKAGDVAEKASRIANAAEGAADGAGAGAGAGARAGAGAGNASRAGEAAKLTDLQKNAQSVATYGRIMQGITAMSVGTASAGSGAIDAMKAGDQRDAAIAQADKQKIQATIMKIQRLLAEERETLKKVLDEMSNITTVVSEVLANAASTRSQIASASPHQAI